MTLLWANKLVNNVEMNKFLETYHLPRLNHEEIKNLNRYFTVVQLLSCVWFFETPWPVARQAPLSFTISQSLLKFMSFESVMLYNHLILCWFFFPLPSIFPRIRVLSNESALHIIWPKYWSFSFSISSYNEYSGLYSFSIDLVDLAV